MEIFTPSWADSVSVTNAATATAAVTMPFNARTVLITNTSATARVHLMMTYYPDGAVGAGDAPTLSSGVPVLPGQQIRVGLRNGAKVMRTIATGADGNTILTFGEGG